MASSDRAEGEGRRRAIAAAGVAAILACGLASLALGQDRNWDLRNYHLYNAYAWLEGRLAVDLAPAQLQSYFTPLLDVPYFLLVKHASAEWAGFVLGAWHGLNFALVAVLAQKLSDEGRGRARLALLLALAGCTGAAFLSELGNTMGDNSTAVFVLGALLAAWPSGGREPATACIAVAGALLGLAVALKLTNAIYAVGLGGAVLLQSPGRVRWRAFAVLAASATAVFAATAGPWHWALWRTFGNPLFPQFNSWFGAPLAQAISVADTQWGPRNLGEVLGWPLVFTLDPTRVGTSPLPQATWAALYAAALAVGLRLLLRGRPASEVGDCRGERHLFVFFGLSFLAWMAVFNIYRYLVVLELLAPLVLWRLLRPRWPAVAPWLIASTAAVSLVGWNTWGHSGWNDPDFIVERPASPDPSSAATVLLVGSEPMAWMVPFMPTAWSYVSVASNFPEAPAYRRAVLDRVRAHPEAAYAVLPVEVDRQVARAARIEAAARRFGFDDCEELRWLAQYVKRVAVVRDAGGRCRFDALPKPGVAGASTARGPLADAARTLAGYRLVLMADSCRVLEARIGDERRPYRWCRVRVR